jgi:F420-dependent oxidoreductase-like protein
VEERSLRDRVGILVRGTDARRAIARIHEAERADIQQVWLSVSDAGFADILTVIAAAASQTERIRLGTAIVPTYTRHPLVMAQQALAIHDLAPGRLRLGVGSGDRFFLETRYGIPQTTPLAHLKEYLDIMRGALWEGKIDYQGTFFQVADGLPRTAPVPLLIPALGLKAFRLAGESTDGAIPSMCPIPYLLEQALPTLQAGAAAQKRPAPPIVALLPVALSTDGAAVRAAMRRQMQWALRTKTYIRMYTQAGFGGAVNGDEDEINKLARALVISGDETTVRDRVQELLASGVDELLLTLMPIADEAREREQLLRLVGSLPL